MIKHIVTATMIVTVAIMTAVLSHRGSEATPPDGLANHPQGLADNRAELPTSLSTDRPLARLTPLISPHSASEPASVVKPVKARSEVVTTGGSAPISDDEQRAVVEEQRRAYVSEISQSFAAESVDTTWAFEASTKVRQAFDSEGDLQGLTHRVDCRSTICRLEIDDDGSGNLGKGLPLLLNSMAEELPRTVGERVPLGKSQNKIVLYMSRSSSSGAAASR